MIKPARRFAARVEPLESRALLSTMPIVTQAVYNQVLRQIDLAAGTFAKTHNPTAFDAALARISFKVPNGNSQLYPTWQADEGIYSAAIPGSGVQMVQQLKADLQSYVVTAVASGSMIYR